MSPRACHETQLHPKPAPDGGAILSFHYTSVLKNNLVSALERSKSVNFIVGEEMSTNWEINFT